MLASGVSGGGGLPFSIIRLTMADIIIKSHNAGKLNMSVFITSSRIVHSRVVGALWFSHTVIIILMAISHSMSVRQSPATFMPSGESQY